MADSTARTGRRLTVDVAGEPVGGLTSESSESGEHAVTQTSEIAIIRTSSISFLRTRVSLQDTGAGGVQSPQAKAATMCLR